MDRRVSRQRQRDERARVNGSTYVSGFADVLVSQNGGGSVHAFDELQHALTEPATQEIQQHGAEASATIGSLTALRMTQWLALFPIVCGIAAWCLIRSHMI